MKLFDRQVHSRCRLCNGASETPTYLLSACEALVHTEYIDRHDRICKIIQWHVLKNCNVWTTKKPWEHVPETFTVKNSVQVHYDHSTTLVKM